MKRWLRKLYYQHFLSGWKHEGFRSVENAAVVYNVQVRTVRRWAQTGHVRSYCVGNRVFVHCADTDRQYDKVRRISEAQHERYERERADKADKRPLVQKMGDAQDSLNALMVPVVLAAAEKKLTDLLSSGPLANNAGATVEEPAPFHGHTNDTLKAALQPQGDADDDTRH